MPLQERLSPSSPLKPEYVAARQHQGSNSHTRFDSCKLMYMDVGVWGGGPSGQAKTTFGLICGNDVLLCSWLNLMEQGIHPWPDYKHIVSEGIFDLSPGARKFLEASRELKRGFVMCSTRSDSPLTDPGQPVMVIPDLHLHLYKGELIDRFQFLPTSPVVAGKFAESASSAGLRERREILSRYQSHPQGPALTSLDEELANAIDIAKYCGADIVQLGDLYEVWEGEILLRMQYLQILQAQEELKKIGARAGIANPLRSDDKRMLAMRRVVPRDLQETFSNYAWRTREFPADVVDKYGVDFIRTKDICDAIRHTHPILFQGGDGTNLFKYQIDGNHDNQKMNFYWIQFAPKDYRDNEVLGEGTYSGKRHLEEVSTQIGTGDHPIHIEHGHRYDWHNNDENWWKDDAGFDTVFSFLIGLKSVFAGLGEGSLRGTLGTGGQRGREIADWWAQNHNYDMRKPGCRRADEVFNEKRNVRLFIMGHTHDPQLWAVPFRCSFAEQLPGWRHYVCGDKWWGKPHPKRDEYLRELNEDDAKEMAAGAY